ncbi:hypothetical protein [Nocardiopsis sp. CC223A]|uniref:hypothetical protein n=1 Tax=Nocardiopsis sp. CC223A TaxID=3044051 RepID=UPI00279601CE|nr:hypothetical protein [Nocardiopsis sp. CC223A]
MTPLCLTLIAASCHPTEEVAEEGDGLGDVSLRWSSRMAKLHILDAMLQGEDADEVILLDEQQVFLSDPKGERWDSNHQVLVESGILVEQSGEISVNFDEETWNVGGDHDISFDDVGQALTTVLSLKTLNWCGEEMTGGRFFSLWHDRFQGSLSSEDEYLENIEDYVACRL